MNVSSSETEKLFMEPSPNSMATSSDELELALSLQLNSLFRLTVFGHSNEMLFSKL